MHKRTLPYVLISLFVSGCGGSFVMERVNIEDGMVVGDEQVIVDGNGQVIRDSEDGYVPQGRYLKAYEYDDNLGPNAPGYIE